MKKVRIVVTFAVLFLLMTPITHAQSSTKGFSDVPTDFWAEQAITYFSEQGIVNGYGDGTFKPNKPITRGQAAAILTTALNLPSSVAFQLNYSDMDENHPSYLAVAAVTEHGIMGGINGKFMPNKPLTRAQFASMVAAAFKLDGNGETSWKDVNKDSYMYDAIDAVVTNGIASGYPDNTFKPNKPTTRAQFAVMLASVVKLEDRDLVQLLKEAYTNEVNAESYKLEGAFDLALRLPESALTDPNVAPIAQMFENIHVDFSGVYQNNPMMMDLTIDLTLQGQFGMNVSMPMVMTSDKLWIKPPETPLFPVPPELEGKFIEYDMATLNGMNGQPGLGMGLGGPMMNPNLQTDLAVALNNLFIDQFGGFYHYVDKDAIDVPAGIDTKQVVKFEVNNESLNDFIRLLVEGYLPEFFELLENPEYVNAIGLTPEEVEAAKLEIGMLQANVDEMIAEFRNVVDIRTFEQYAVIDENNFIAYTDANFDLDITQQQETIGFSLSLNQHRTNINEDVTIILPNKNEVVAYKRLIEREEKLMLEQ